MHAREAGLVEAAAGHFETAGKQALAKPAYHEAIANLCQAVELLRTTGGTGPRRERELELQIIIGQARIAGFGYGAAETADAFQRALELVDEEVGLRALGSVGFDQLDAVPLYGPPGVAKLEGQPCAS